MGSSNVDEITRAIATLAPGELNELYSWLELHCPQPIDSRIGSDLANGRLDAAMRRALNHEQDGRIRSL